MSAVPDSTTTGTGTGTSAIAAAPSDSTMPSSASASLDQTPPPAVAAEAEASTTVTLAEPQIETTTECGTPTATMIATTPTTPMTTTPPASGQPPVVVAEAGPSRQRASKVYASTAEAIANFKPTPREVISGIAPHVFDERKRRRSQKRTSKAYWYELSGQKRSSPLRGATVISWDEHSIYLEQVEQSDHKKLPSNSSDNKKESSSTSSSPSSGSDTHAHARGETDAPDNTQRGVISKRRVKLDKAGWKHFRVDIHLFRSLGVKLRLSAPSTKSKSKP